MRVDRLGDVSVHIDRLTKQLAPKGFSTDPIHIKVVRPDGPTFTLIDLPGTTTQVPSELPVSQAIYAA